VDVDLDVVVDGDGDVNMDATLDEGAPRRAPFAVRTV